MFKEIILITESFGAIYRAVKTVTKTVDRPTNLKGQ